jgi:hypothetical protein
MTRVPKRLWPRRVNSPTEAGLFTKLTG